MERKNFLKVTFALCGLSVIPAAILESCTKASTAAPSNVNFTLDLTSSANAALNAVGGSMVINNVLVIRTSTSTFVALSAVCTHQGCTVGYDSNAKDIACPCHGGVFNMSGGVVSGPPPSALTTYTVTQNGNVITVQS
jgi:cytochrome b6-f complex iron-sulfur subunit